MYSLGSHDEAIKLRESEQRHGAHINPTTGEVVDWFYDGLELANGQLNICPSIGYEYTTSNN